MLPECFLREQSAAVLFIYSSINRYIELSYIFADKAI